MRLSSAMRRAICSDGIEHRGEVAVGESEEMAMDCLRAERSMTLSAYPAFSLFSPAIHLVPPSLSLPAGATFIGGPPSIELRKQWSDASRE